MAELRYFKSGVYDQLTPAFDFIPNTLQDSSVAIIYGPPQSGKTFFALHLLCSAAMPRPVFGLVPEKRRGLYVGLEGEAGVKTRIQAWCIENGAAQNPIAYALGGLNIAEDEEREALTDYMVAQKIQFVVIDTLAQAMTGLDEIAGQDMGVVIAALHHIKRRSKACVVAIAHTGKDARAGIRGHSSQLGNVDTTIEIETLNNPQDAVTHTTPRRASVRKQRDGVTGTKFYFGLTVHETPTLNARGERVKSVAVQETDHFKDWDAADAAKKAPKLTEREQFALDIASDLIAKNARISPTSLDRLKREMKREGWPGNKVKDLPGAIRDVLASLQRKGVLATDADGNVDVRM